MAEDKGLGDENGQDDNDSDDVAWPIKWALQCRNESKLAKWNRTMQTRENWDVYWQRQDFSHKLPGQSRETLSMQAMAVEETAAFFQQALIDMGDEWWSVDPRNPQNGPFMAIDTDTVKAITQMQLLKAEFLRHVSNGMKSGLLGSYIVTKIHGDWYMPPKFVAHRERGSRKARLEQELKKCWKLRLDIISQFNYYPDPTPTLNKMLYEIEDMWVDHHTMVEMSKGEDAIYDPEIVADVGPNSGAQAEAEFDELRRTNQNIVSHDFRGRVKLTEYWGDLLDAEHNVLMENCVYTIANDKWLIRPPTPNPLWHQKSPYTVGTLLDIPDARFPKALMDAPSKHNIAAAELYNLIVDGAMKSVNNIGMIRQDWLEDISQVEGGIRPGTNLNVNTNCPPGAKVLEMVQSGTVPPEAAQAFTIIQQEFNRSALTSDIRQGMQPREQVSATQVVEANQTITSVFQGMSKNIEQTWIQKILEQAWMTCAQYSDFMDEDELRSVISPDKVEQYLEMTPEERFANTVHGVKFRVSGISLTLQKAQDLRRYMTLLQTIGGNENLIEEFVKQGNSIGALLDQIIRTSGIDMRAIKMSLAEQELVKGTPPTQGAQSPDQGQSQGAPMQGAGAAVPGDAPNDMSQVTSPNTGSLQSQLGSAAPGLKPPHEGFHRRG